MQLQRLFEIVYLLLNQKNVTAKELSEHFEVSSRTIYRDIETLSQSGIPIYASKGRGGGIRLIDSFILDKSVLSRQDKQEILSALQGLSAVYQPDTDTVLKKLRTLFGENDPNWIDVDFSNWGENQQREFSLIKEAILHQQVLSFRYYNASGVISQRETEPIQICFKSKSWYLKAFCRDRQALRLFKLNRMKQIVRKEEHFSQKKLDSLSQSSESQQKLLHLKLCISSDMAFRVYDEFSENDIERNKDGSFLVTTHYREDEWVYGFLLSFGGALKVLEPSHIKDILQERAKQILKNYEVDE